ncbi:hypothetical protein OUZ56_006224 [Daphnia magna]|uniref:Carbonic anhydrase n=1 Tax=Daphnia magna TaxID=35525 RepID=A0ABQ9YV09_9CRUS|nr:hypothetical protein OUZ56_006224 [Daphnia magna]
MPRQHKKAKLDLGAKQSQSAPDNEAETTPDLLQEATETQILTPQYEGLPVQAIFRRLHVSGFKGVPSEAEIRQIFRPFGHIETITLRSNRLAYVQFELLDAAQLAIEQLNSVVAEEGKLAVERPDNALYLEPAMNRMIQESKQWNRIYIASVDPDKTEADLRSVFSAFGTIRSCQLIRGSNPENIEGYAFMEYDSDESTCAAIASMNNAIFGKFNLRVGHAITRPSTAIASSSEMPVLFHAALADGAMAAAEGRNLSPIEIISQNAVRTKFPELKFWGYDSNVTLVLHNDGHSVKLSVDGEKSNSVPYITGGSLDGRYKFLQLHFHWGCDAEGSEHTVDGAKFAAEMHIVHQNQVFDSLQEAKNHRNGLAVVAVMLKVQETENAILRPVLQGCHLFKGHSKDLPVPSPLELFLPDPETLNCFFTYFGSLTTPPYNEVVTWIILKEPVGISLKQLETFRTLQGVDGQAVLQNCSSSKNLNNREVFSSF